jgi:aspartate-semialdehyde dehydrogenase
MAMRVGFIGWRGMVGSVLMQRMREQGDFGALSPTFFSTSAAGGEGPTVDGKAFKLEDGRDIEKLKALPVLVSCQGGDYTNEIYPKLKAAGWSGYFIDASSALRMSDEAVLILDPVNRAVIDRGLDRGLKVFVGPNCTVSLMLMAMDGLFRADLVEWVSSMTYQAASGAGAQNMRELVEQMGFVANAARAVLDDPAAGALELDAAVAASLRDPQLPTKAFAGLPLAGSLIPWIDKEQEPGLAKEEWKGHVEGNKILGRQTPVPIDGLCVRVSSMRCHSQALTVKLKRDVPLDEISRTLAAANDWVRVIDNTPDASKRELSPAAVTGKLHVPIGRLRKMRMGPEYLSAFTVGDQLLWGAAEPLRRMLGILKERGVQ